MRTHVHMLDLKESPLRTELMDDFPKVSAANRGSMLENHIIVAGEVGLSEGDGVVSHSRQIFCQPPSLAL